MSGSKFAHDPKTKRSGVENEAILKALLIGATVTNIDTCSGGTVLKEIDLILSDGRTVHLEEENCPSWSHSSEGWINVAVTDPKTGKTCNPAEEP